MIAFTKEDRIHLQAMMIMAEKKLSVNMYDAQLEAMARESYLLATLATRELDKVRAVKVAEARI